MKKMLTILSLLCLSLTALTPLTPLTADAAAPATGIPKNLVIASGPLGGPWYTACTKMSEVAMREIPGINITVIEGSAEGNLMLANRGTDVQLAMTSSMLAYPALTGKNEAKKNTPNLKGVMAVLTSWSQTGTPESSSIKSFSDLIGKRFSSGKRGYISDILFHRIAKEYGVSNEKIAAAGGKIHQVAWGEYPQLLGDGHLDAFCINGEVPHNIVMQIETTIPVRILSVDKEIQEKILKEEPFLVGRTFPAGVYKGTKEPVNLIGYAGILVANDKLSDEFLTKFVAAMQNNKDEILKEVPFMDLLGWDLAMSGIGEETMRPAVLKQIKEKQ
ncbi:MAG: hypothetical protein DELT_01175 [Desulfovibrio sp.]